MANLQTTTATNFTVSTSSTAATIRCSNSISVQQWAGFVGIQTPYYDPSGNFANVFANTAGYTWITGYIAVPANQSYNTSHAFYFALSRYGLDYTWTFNDGLLGLSLYQDPTNPNINYLRMTNNYNASWAYGNYHLNMTVFTPVNAISSSYLTRVN